jgi:predicted Zn-dependent protease
MFGSFQYGSELLNVSFDPKFQNEFASYSFDDDGQKAEKMLLIEKGILKAPLGGTLSSHRADLQGAASTRACNWNRPPIDRMANLNVEPGHQSLDELISRTETGVLMKTNTSWSIDDSRNKFQFSCEYGQLIENGELTTVVKNPSYRGVSSNFWNNLIGVGDRDSAGHYGTPFCGKGEPNQAIRVGHASPACLFQGIEIFGGGR